MNRPREPSRSCIGLRQKSPLRPLFEKPARVLPGRYDKPRHGRRMALDYGSTRRDRETRLPTRQEFAALTAAIAEAVAACEAAQANFIRIRDEIDMLVAHGQVLTRESIQLEARARDVLSGKVTTLARELTQAGYGDATSGAAPRPAYADCSRCGGS